MAKPFYSGIDLKTQKAVNLGSPTAPGDAVNKSYVDNALVGLRWKEPVRAASTGNLTLSGTQTVDDVALVADDRVLVKDQTDGTENGIYLVAAGAWTRTTDADSTAELHGATVLVTTGTANGDKSFNQNTDNPTIGSSSIVFAQFGGTGVSYSADGDGITLSGTTFSLELDPAGSGLSKGSAGLKVADALAGSGLGIASGVLSVNVGTGLEIATDSVQLAATVAGDGLTHTAGVLAVGGGTGLTVSTDGVAVDTSVVVRKYVSNVGALTAGTPLTITHNLGTEDVTVSVRELATDEHVEMDVKATGVNTITLTTAAAHLADVFRVTVHG